MTLLIHSGTLLRWHLDRVEPLRQNLLVTDNRITAITPDRPPADDTLDATGCVVIPGLINTHHHLFQSLTRCLKSVQNADLFDWLTGLYEVWQRGIDFASVRTGAQVSLAELLLSGCTTTNDMTYLYPRHGDMRFEAVVEAATALGIRLHAGRGAMSLGRSRGGLAPDKLTEDEATILADCQRVIDRFHDPRPFAMLRVDLMPCAPFLISPELFRDTRQLARDRRVLCHTHVAETPAEEQYCLEHFGQRPAEYMATAGWIGPDVSWAHGVCLTPADLQVVARTGTAIAHCPSSNMILGSGIAPVAELLAAGATVGLGVDGSSSNNGGNLLAECRQALLLQRVQNGADAFSPEQAFHLATRGGATLLNRAAELGNLAPGAAADIAVFDLNTVEYAGAAAHDPLGALMTCHAPRARYVVVNGRVVVRKGDLTTVDTPQLVARMNDLVARRFRPA